LYHFNEGSGLIVYDASSNANTGTITGATWNSDVPSAIIDPPSDVVLISPLNGSNGNVKPITLVWNKAKLAESYNLQLSLDSDFLTILIDSSGIIDTSYNIDELNELTMYYWRVKATNINGYGSWSDVSAFKTGIMSEDAWITNLEIIDNGQHSEKLTFGVHPIATDGVDAILEEGSLPPLPPVGIMDVRFILPILPEDASLKNHRSSLLDSIY